MRNKMFKTIVIVVLFGVAGVWAVSETAQPQVSVLPLYDHLIEISPKWKEAYGDTLETRFIYNLAILRNNQMEIAKMIAKLHPPIEPNAPIDPNQ